LPGSSNYKDKSWFASLTRLVLYVVVVVVVVVQIFAYDNDIEIPATVCSRITV